MHISEPNIHNEFVYVLVLELVLIIQHLTNPVVLSYINMAFSVVVPTVLLTRSDD